MVLRQHSIQFNTLRPVQNVRGFISAVINILCKISLSDDKSSLVQIMAWCHQATSHYLTQSWPRSMSSHDVTRPRWVRQFSWQRVNHCRMLSDSYIQNNGVDKPNFLKFLVKMAKMTLKVKANDPYFQYQPKVSHDACFMQISWFQRKSVTSYCADKVKFRDRWTDRWMEEWADRCRQRQGAWKARGKKWWFEGPEWVMIKQNEWWLACLQTMTKIYSVLEMVSIANFRWFLHVFFRKCLETSLDGLRKNGQGWLDGQTQSERRAPTMKFTARMDGWNHRQPENIMARASIGGGIKNPFYELTTGWADSAIWWNDPSKDGCIIIRKNTLWVKAQKILHHWLNEWNPYTFTSNP